ncbi:archaea-specific SMC-related protein [Halorubrum lacusprofundi]|jgi:DNA repair exonuclease SbcCD ATPase subunit|uniref:Kinetochore-Ndc80 subunit Spc25 n=1 Tax=Halorubrum lacusprofundi (strain ATCC 49239 / DSM 5036 / JCM 8891 / ACAM 34) TaxID=416348 RepID=B9LRU7_HALLT|nr:archaea-specific SMC-related protein [Halorubrum lacusprofundi]ACM57821.1 Kinetochore-Ndc80 subunit Spc25 [Halorubrum lacusprofundi ATCC 49239]MCG1007025.1 chromosome segregation protein SMC [Halorubrum lacusprofundi]
MDHISKPVVRVDVRNIGGIDEASVTLPDGVSILTGRNATNRTSFLQALMAGLGSRQSSLKGDAEEGEVALELGDETYTRTLQRRGDSVAFGGDPYLDDPELADLFAFLLENNEARQAVARGDDLREIIMRPIDTDSIDAEIRECKRERDDLETEIEKLDSLERDLPNLEADRREKVEELEAAEEDLQSVREKLDDLDTGVEESRTRKQEMEEAFQRVRDARSALDDLEFDLETERSTLAELKSEREELRETVEEAEDPDENPDRLAGRIDELRRRKRSLDDDVNELGSVIGFNEDMVDGSGIDIDGEPTTDEPTDALTAGDQTVCWTCGSEVETDQIEATLDRLRELRSDKLDERNEIRAEIQELTDEQSAIREAQREIERAKERLDAVETEIESTESRIADLEDRIASKREEIEELEADAESIDVDGYDEALELHREANGIELRIERIEDKIDEIDDEIDEREAAIERREDLKAEREELADRLTELRTRVDRIEENAVEEFNEHMGTVLDILEYENLDRIWIERRETEVREGRRKVMRTRFDLHIVRSSPDGTAYEDTVDHLSESEREVTGLVFALAGYLVHDVHETVPFILLDSLEAIDSDRIARVVDYFRTHADYLVAALLPEDADALPEEYAYVENID